MDDRSRSKIPDAPLPPGLRPIRLKKPVFIGHYWLAPKASKEPLSAMVACVDYSAGIGGPLVAYRWMPGDAGLEAGRFVEAG